MFEVTHPFHPLRGQRFSLATRKCNWGEDRVMYFNRAGQLRSMPTSWTSEATEECFLTVSAGRSWYRVDDLDELTALLETVQSLWRSRQGSVK